MARVTLDELTVRFGAVQAVDKVSLEIGEGEFIVLLGPSGCGKTTTLRCIAGLETASDGHILFDGVPVERLSAKRRNVAMVFQFVSLYPHLNLRENIAFPLRARGERGAGVAEKVTRIAQTFDLSDVLDKRPSALPPGRLAEGRARPRRGARAGSAAAGRAAFRHRRALPRGDAGGSCATFRRSSARRRSTSPTTSGRPMSLADGWC